MDTRTAPNATTRGAPADDLSALAWVQDELRRTLEAATSRCAVLPEGGRGGRRLRRRHRRPGRAARAQLHPPGRRRARAGRPARGRAGAARQRVAGAEVRRQAAQAHGAGRRQIERASFRAARLPRPPAGRQAGRGAGDVPQYRAVQEPGRRRAHPPGRPVERRLALARDPPDTSVPPRADAATRDDGRPPAGHHAHAAAGAGGRAHERRLRRAGRGRHRSAGGDVCGSSPPRFLRGAGPRPARISTFSKRVASRLLAQYRRAARARARTRCPSAWRRTCCSSARSPIARRRRRAPRLAAVRQVYGWRTSCRSTITPARWAASTRRCWCRRASASPRPGNPGRAWPAANCIAWPA